MKYTILLLGKNIITKDMIFQYLEDDFCVLSSSLRVGDVRNHLDVCSADAVILCTKGETREELLRLMTLSGRMKECRIPVILLGTKSECETLERLSLPLFDYHLYLPMTPGDLRDQIVKYLDFCKKWWDENPNRADDDIPDFAGDRDAEKEQEIRIAAQERKAFEDSFDWRAGAEDANLPEPPRSEEELMNSIGDWESLSFFADTRHGKSFGYGSGDGAETDQREELSAEDDFEGETVEPFNGMDPVIKDRWSGIEERWKSQNDADSPIGDWTAPGEDTAARLKELRSTDFSERLESIQPRKHILIVDDDLTMQKLSKEYLKENYDTDTVSNARAALRFLKGRLTDLLLIEYGIVESEGATALEELRRWALLHDIPVILMARVTRKERIKQALLLKPQGFLLKPIDRTKLTETVEKLIG